MGLIFWLSHQSRLPGPETPDLRWLMMKTAHFLVYAGLAWLWCRAFRVWLTTPARPHSPLYSWLVPIILSLFFAISDEWHQTFIPGRNGTPVDIMIDCLGISFGIVVFNLFNLTKSKSYNY